MSQVRVQVTTSAAALVVIEPRLDALSKYKDRAANGVAEVTPDKHFGILVSNFSTAERRFPKGMVIEFATKHPLEFIPVGGDTRAEIAKCLHLGTEIEKEEDYWAREEA